MFSKPKRPIFEVQSDLKSAFEPSFVQGRRQMTTSSTISSTTNMTLLTDVISSTQTRPENSLATRITEEPTRNRFGYPSMMATVQDQNPTIEQAETQTLVERVDAANDVILNQVGVELNDWFIEEMKFVARVKILKDTFNGNRTLSIKDLEEDELLSTAFVNNMDVFEDSGHGTFCRKSNLDDKTDEDINWRIYNYATFTDLKHFLIKEPWPQIAVPVALITPCNLLCLEIDPWSDVRGDVQQHVESYLNDGHELIRAEVTYGSSNLLVQTTDEGTKYLRVVALSYIQADDNWLVTPIDTTNEPPVTPILSASYKDLYQLPKEITIDVIKPWIFLAALRGLVEFKPGSIEFARSCLETDVILTVAMNERGCLVLPFPNEGDDICPVDLVVINADKDGELEGLLVSELLYCKSAGLPVGPIHPIVDHPFWMCDPDVRLFRPDLKRIVEDIQARELEECQGSQDLGSQQSLSSPAQSITSSPQKITKASSSMETDMQLQSGRGTIQMQPLGLENNCIAKEEKLAIDRTPSFEEFMRKTMVGSTHATMMRSMLKMCHETSNVTREEFDYLLERLGLS